MGAARKATRPSSTCLYDYLPRSNPFFAPGELVAAVSFPVNLPEELGGGKSPIAVLVVAADGEGPLASSTILGFAPDSFFDIFVDLDLDGVGDGTPEELGLDIGAAVGFGPSPNEPFSPHLIVELEVSLRIPAGFADPEGPLPGGGINPETGLYDPDPVFWGGSFAGGGGGEGEPRAAGSLALQVGLTGPATGGGTGSPGTSATFQINPDGSTTASSNFVPTSFDARAEKLGVIDKLRSLLADLVGSPGSNSNGDSDSDSDSDSDQRRLKKAIKRIEQSLEFILPDGTHLDPRHGHRVFTKERQAVKELLKLIKDRRSLVDKARLETCILALVEVDRNLALTAIADAEARFGDADKIAQAKEQLAKGDDKLANWKPDKAIHRYRQAWKKANQA